MIGAIGMKSAAVMVMAMAWLVGASGCMASPDGRDERAERTGAAGADSNATAGVQDEGDEGGAEAERPVDGAGVQGCPSAGGVRIRNPATDRCLTVAPGELFALATGCSSSSAFQRWDVVCDGDGPIEIIAVGLSESVGADICLTIVVPEPGAAPTLNPCDGSVSQAWEVAPVPGKAGQVHLSNQDQYLEAGSGGPNVIVEPLADLARQRWRLSP